MAVPDNMDALEWLRKTSRKTVATCCERWKSFAEQLMAAEVNAMCGASYGERTPERVTKRNAYRGRDFDTRAGTIPLAIRSSAGAATSRTGCSSPGVGPSRR